MQKRILIAGGTGLIGQAIQARANEAGWEVYILSRNDKGANIIQWNPQRQHISLEAPMAFHAIINLAGASIAGKRWTPERKRIILESRLVSAATIEKYIQNGILETEVYVGASAIGIYGDRRGERMDEYTSVDQQIDWLATTARLWEEAHLRLKAIGIRTIIVRIGLVLTPKGGAMKEMIRTAPFGFLGYFGDGQQQWSWIHLEDLVRVFLHMISGNDLEGIYLGTAPFPETNKRITRSIGDAYSPHRIVMPVPKLLLSIVLGEMHTMLFQDCRCHPSRLLKAGFTFNFPGIEEAIQDLMAKKKS